MKYFQQKLAVLHPARHVKLLDVLRWRPPGRFSLDLLRVVSRISYGERVLSRSSGISPLSDIPWSTNADCSYTELRLPVP